MNYIRKDYYTLQNIKKQLNTAKIKKYYMCFNNEILFNNKISNDITYVLLTHAYLKIFLHHNHFPWLNPQVLHIPYALKCLGT